jgi:hypothetical protein
MSASLHKPPEVNDPFPPLSSYQFPALYIRNPIKNQYRKYMKIKSPYQNRPKSYG